MCIFYIHCSLLCWLVAGGLIDSPRPQNVAVPLETGITKVPEGSPRFENVCQHFIINLKGPSASWMFFHMTRLIYSVLYKYKASPPQIKINPPTLTSVTFSNWESPLWTQMFALCTIWILHTNLLCNIHSHSPYHLGMIASHSLRLISSECSGLVSASVKQLVSKNILVQLVLPRLWLMFFK